jgi:membrane fusion protein, multidrug efflux system
MTRPARAARVASLAAVLAGLVACGGHGSGGERGAAVPGRGSADTPGATRAPVAVRTARAGGGAGAGLEIPGTVEAVDTAAIASRAAATVIEVRAEIGDRVRKGTLLVRLDDRDLQARARGAEAGLRAAEAQLERMRGLVARDAATAREVESAEAAAAAATAEHDAALAQIAYTELRAPFDGRIADRRVRPGDLASPGQTLLVVQGAGTLRVAATVSRAVADGLATGAAVSVARDDGAPIEARLAVIAPAGDPASQRVLIKADLPPDAGVRAGSFVRMRLPGGGESPVSVPRAALVERGALTGVYVVADGRARLRWISPGAVTGDAVEVRAGIAPGETVVVAPSGLTDGDAVTVTDRP